MRTDPDCEGGTSGQERPSPFQRLQAEELC